MGMGMVFGGVFIWGFGFRWLLGRWSCLYGWYIFRAGRRCLKIGWLSGLLVSKYFKGGGELGLLESGS